MTRPTAKRRPRARRRPRNLVLLGSPERTVEVEPFVAQLDVTRRRTSWAESIDESVDEDTVAVLVTEEPPTAPLWKSLRTLRSLLADSIALIVLVPDETPAPGVKRLYDSGAAAVLEWPGDSENLARILAEILALRHVHGPVTESDKALTRVVKALLRTTMPSASGVSVKVREGVATLAGEVRGLWLVREIQDAVARIAGIRRVLVGDLQVEATGRSDRSIRDAVRHVLSSVTSDTVSVAVRAGRVALAGSVGTRAELRRLRDLVSHVRGVRSIDNQIVVSERAQARDSSVAARVRRALESRYPDHQISVRVFGGHAVIEGDVETLAIRQDVNQVVHDVPGVRSVLDKLDVLAPFEG